MHLDAVAAGRDSKYIDHELVDGRIGAEEEVAAQDTPGDQVGGAWSDLARLAHGRRTQTNAAP
jgi:hypothetical protein